MRLETALKLGRVSNVPTVWSNVLAGGVLAGGSIQPVPLVVMLLAMSLMYVGGMFLNDAFDAAIDIEQGKDRPIAKGEVGRSQVLMAGFAMLAVGIGLTALLGWLPALSAAALAAAILLYDMHHKGNPLSPVVMGLCRVLVYGTAGLALGGTMTWALAGGAAAALCYLIGLTYAAKQENLNSIGHLWPLAFLIVPFVYLAPQLMGNGAVLALFVLLAAWVLYALSFLRPGAGRKVPKAVVSLIAGISLLDATLVAAAGSGLASLLAILCFAATLAGQRRIAGT